MVRGGTGRYWRGGGCGFGERWLRSEGCEGYWLVLEGIERYWEVLEVTRGFVHH